MMLLFADFPALPVRLARRPPTIRTDRVVGNGARRMPRDAVLRVERPLGRTVRCLDGCLWLTFDGDSRDVILYAGREHRCDRNTLMAIQALDGCAELRIE